MTLPTHIEAVFCDVGGPIYDDENFVGAVLAALDELLAADGRPTADRAAVRSIYDRVRVAQGGSFRTALATEILGDGTRRGELHDRTREHWVHPPSTLYPDAAALLRALHGRVVTGILANQETTVVDALTRDGLAPFIDVWGVSAVVGHEKPSAEFFRWALAEAGVPADRAVHIGNRLDTDVRPARALGMGTVWVLRGDAPDRPTADQLAEPDLAVETLDGLADILLGATGVPR